MKILLPVSLDQWRSPISSLLRAVVKQNQQHDFYSFANPLSSEDRNNAEELWNIPWLNAIDTTLVWRRKFDLVHTASLNPRNLAIAAFFRLRGSKFLTTVNLEPGEDMPFRDSMSFALASKLADYWSAVSKCVRDSCMPTFCGDFVGVTPNGCDIPMMSENIEDCNQSHENYVLFVSALEPRKHPEVFVELAKLNPDVKFVGVGWEHPMFAGNFMPDLQGLPNLDWRGHLDQAEVHRLMRHAKLLIFPSEREGLPLTVIEAIALGVPILAQPKSSLPELIREDVNGWLRSIDDLTEWSQIIRLCISNRRGDVISSNPEYRKIFLDSFSWNVVSESFYEIYDRISRDISKK